MLNLSKQVNKLRFCSFFLFIVPVIALVGSLTFSNILVEFDATKPPFPFHSSSKENILCNNDNNYCEEYFYIKSNNFEDCTINYYEKKIQNQNNKYGFADFKNKFFKNNKIKKEFESEIFELTLLPSDELSSTCIKNNKFKYKVYNIFPGVINLLYSIKNDSNFSAATSNSVYPFLFGETSISNIVKRYPINYLFKPLMFLASILMVLYWKLNNNVFNLILNKNENNKFFIFGILSAIFLFFHVLFLGLDYNNELFKSLRKIIIFLFILFEVIAQYNLVQKIRRSRNELKKFIKLNILTMKIVLISIVIAGTFVILFILTFYDLSKTFDYFLEWNYFLILLFFYLLSSIMWRRQS